VLQHPFLGRGQRIDPGRKHCRNGVGRRAATPVGLMQHEFLQKERVPFCSAEDPLRQDGVEVASEVCQQTSALVGTQGPERDHRQVRR
jgi:hypothetical protein